MRLHERTWSRASPTETPPQRAARLNGHKEHQARQRARRLAHLDVLLDRASDALNEEWAHCAPAQPCGIYPVDWSALPAGCDPCSVSAKMAPGTARGERKRESISAIAYVLSTLALSAAAPTIVDAGCGTGSLLLPLAALFPNATFVGIDYKQGSIARLAGRASEAGDPIAGRVVPWKGRIEDYDGPIDALVSLHACGGASDAALRVAAERRVPFAVSPCCIGKLRRGPSSRWLQQLLLAHRADDPDPTTAEAKASQSFALLAAWADSEHVGAAVAAPSSLRKGALAGADAATDAAAAAHLVAATRRERSKTLVELDRLIGMHETAMGGGAMLVSGRLLSIQGRAMATSGQTELLVGSIRAA